jgi:hypothetical protein
VRSTAARLIAVEAALAGRDRFAWLQWASRSDLERLHELAEDSYSTEAARLEALEIECRAGRRMLDG